MRLPAGLRQAKSLAMSKQTRISRKTVKDIAAAKGGEPLVCLTAYDAPMAVVVDMPFGSYETSEDQAFLNAARIMKETGCQAVKIESGAYAATQIAHLVERGIPVMGHVGLRPQAVNVDGGFRAKGRTESERDIVLNEARAADEAGAFAIVIEGVARDLADEITKAVSCPTIGIGASASCDGQVLVTQDMLGLFDWAPKFVRRYADLRSEIDTALGQFAVDVRSREFPGEAETYSLRKPEAKQP